MSAPILSRSTLLCGAAWAPSTITTAPLSWAMSHTAFTGTVHPVTLLACCTETALTSPFMQSMNESMSNSPSGLDLVILLLMPAVSASLSQGTWLELCSESVVTTTSPFPRPRPYAAVLRAWVALSVKQ